jgi:hypothetical protein
MNSLSLTKAVALLILSLFFTYRILLEYNIMVDANLGFFFEMSPPS